MQNSTKRFFFVLFLSAISVFQFKANAQTVKKEIGGSTSIAAIGNPGPVKTQLIYTPSDLGGPAAGVIDRLYLKNAAADASGTYTDFTIKLGASPNTSFGSNGTEFFSGLTTVFYAANLTINGGPANAWIPFNISDLYYYSGLQTMIVEISFSSNTNQNFATVSSTSPAAPNNKKVFSGDLAALVGTTSNNWQDIGFDYATNLPIPTNDNCSSALTLTISNDCNAFVNNTIGASNSTVPISNCGGFTSPNAHDVWYRFVAKAANDSVYVLGQGGFDPVVQIFSGSCSNLASMVCADANGQDGLERVSAGNFIAGQTYFIRVYGYGFVDGSFNLCITTDAFIPAPSNDNCSAATTVTPQLTCSPTTGTNVSATQSIAPSTCNGFASTEARDVWYRFVAQNANDTVLVTPGFGFDAVVEIFSGSCIAPVSLGCTDNFDFANEKLWIGSLIPGNTYWVRVYGFNTSVGTFQICIRRGVSANLPVNDNCTSATNIVPSSQCLSITGNTTFATQSLPPIPCNNATSSTANDVWYSFVAQNSLDSILVAPAAGFDPVVELYSGDCPNLLSLTCSDNGPSLNEVIKPGNLIPGNTYFLRVYGYSGGFGQFSICIKTRANPPVNDECAAAITLNPGTTCNAINGNTTSATQSRAALLCNGTTAASALDVWYKVIPATLGDTVIVTGIGTFDPVLEWFSGTCTSLLSRGCSDNSGFGKVEKMVFSGATVGTTYFIRVYGFFGPGQFTICVKSPIQPSNDECINAIQLTSSNTCNPISAKTSGATQSRAPILCNSFTSASSNDVWFRFVPNAQTAQIRVGSIGTFDPIIEAFTGSCNSLVSIGCADDSVTGQDENLGLVGLTPNVPVFIRVYGWGTNGYGDFTICAINNPCVTPTPANITVNPLETVSNGTVVGFVPVSTGVRHWEVSKVLPNWGTANSAAQRDTFFLNSNVKDTIYFRLKTTFGTCIPSYSNEVGVKVDGATRFSQPNSKSTGYYVTSVNFSGINNTSTFDPFGGGYQNFRNISANVCAGGTFPISIARNNISTTVARNAVWIDFNGDGDFSDPGENVLAPTLTSGILSQNISIPTNAITGTVKMRVILFDPGTSIPSTDPYFNGFYNFGEIEEYSVNISGPPTTSNAGSNFTTCSPNVNLNGNTPTIGTGTWTVVSGNGNVLNPNAPTPDVTNLSVGINVFRWTIATACTTSSSTVTVTYNGSAPVASAGADQNLCSTNSSLSGNAVSGNAIGTWTLLSGAGLVENPNNAGSTVSNLGLGLNRFIWTISLPGCSSTKDTVSITRFQNPSPAQAGSDQNICLNSTQLTGNQVTVGEGTWTLVSGSGQISNPNNNTSLVSGLSSGINTFRWTTTNGTCPSSQDEVSITVTNGALANAGSDQNICSDQTVLSGNNTGTGSWSVVSGSGSFTNASLANTAVNGLGIGANKFVWTLVSGNCPATKDTVVITRVNATSASAGSDQSVCGGQASLNGNSVSSGSGLWTVVSGSGTFGNASDPFTTVTNVGAGLNTYRWTVSNAPCPVVFDEVSITNLGNATIASAGSDQTLCASNATLAGNIAVFGTGQWSLISGAGQIAAVSNPNSPVSGLGVGLNVFRWTISNGNCPNTFDDVIVTRVGNLSVANAGQDQNICTNSANLSANAPASGSGLWTLISGSGLITEPGNPVTTVSGLGQGNNVFRWTISNQPCVPSFDEVAITTTLNAVSAQAGQDQVVCGESATLSGNAPGTGNGVWTVVSGAGTFTNPNSGNSGVTGLGTGLNVFQWTITNGTCAPSFDNVTIERTINTSQANAGSDQNICTSTSSLSGNVASNGTGVWTLVSGTANIVDPSNPLSQVTGLGNGSNVFRWTISNFPCAQTSDEITITTTLSAIAANAGSDQNICGTSSQLIGNNQGNGTGQWTLVSGNGQITNPGGSQTSVTGLGIGPNIFKWTITTGTCPASSDEITIFSVSNPIAAFAGADQTICGTSASLTGNAAGQNTGTWSLVSGSGTIANPGSVSTSVIGLGNGANVFRWTISNPPCTPTFDEVTINASPGNVTAVAGSDRTICGNSAFLNATAPATGFGVWSVVSGSAIIAQPANPVSEVTNLSSGINTFAWTVTAGSCSASDLVSVTREVKTLDLGKDSLVCIGSTLTLQAQPGFANYTWFDNSSSPSLVVGSSGTYWVQVLTNTGCTFRDSIKVTFVTCTDVKPLAKANSQIEIYPNPNEGRFGIKFENAKMSSSQVAIYNTKGVLVWKGEVPVSDSTIEAYVDMKKPSPGMYIVEMSTEKGKVFRKMVVR